MVKRLEIMVEEQIAIVKKLVQNENLDMTAMASRERRQEESFKTLQQVINEAVDSMEKLSSEASQQLSDLAESELTKTISSDLNDARNEMQNQNQSGATQSAGNASDGLQEMLEIAQDIQSDFQEDTVDEMLRKFLALIRNLLFISQSQEELVIATQGLRSRSPNLLHVAVKQDHLIRENQQFMLQLTELSRQTFHGRDILFLEQGRHTGPSNAGSNERRLQLRSRIALLRRKIQTFDLANSVMLVRFANLKRRDEQ